VRRRPPLLLILAVVVVFLVVSALLARVYSSVSAERSGVTALVGAEARGDQERRDTSTAETGSQRKAMWHVSYHSEPTYDTYDTGRSTMGPPRSAAPWQPYCPEMGL